MFFALCCSHFFRWHHFGWELLLMILKRMNVSASMITFPLQNACLSLTFESSCIGQIGIGATARLISSAFNLLQFQGETVFGIISDTKSAKRITFWWILRKDFSVFNVFISPWQLVTIRSGGEWRQPTLRPVSCIIHHFEAFRSIQHRAVAPWTPWDTSVLSNDVQKFAVTGNYRFFS